MNNQLKVLVVAMVAIPSLTGVQGSGKFSERNPLNAKCEPISIPMCQNIAYNMTIFPNLLNHDNQEEAGNEMSSFFPLIKISCSKDIQLFLCALYAPVCTILDFPIPPCRALCLSAKNGCESVMKQFDYSWPDKFHCDRFPTGGNPEKLCMGDSQHTNFSDSDLERLKTSTSRPPRPGDFENMMNFKCPVQLQIPPDHEYKLLIGRDQVIEDCGAPCYHNVTFFDKNQIQFAHNWIASWSVISLCSCLFTLSTFLLDMSRFSYPQRPIIYICLCFCIISILFLIGYGFEEDIVCNTATENRVMNFVTERTIRQGALQDWKCTLTAIAFYYCLLAGSIWWVMLNVAWFLSIFMNWRESAIALKSQMFHTIAWTVPAILTVVVPVQKKVEGDVLSGVCFVGGLNFYNTLHFLIIPLSIFLGLGCLFFVAGYISICRIKTIMKHDVANTDGLVKLISRIGFFSLLYIIPAFALICCYVYEYINLPDWQQMWQEKVCRDKTFANKWQTPCRYPDGQGPSIEEPKLAIFLLKYTAILLIGIISGSWIWCGKTLITWRNFFANFRKLFNPQRSDQAFV